MFANSADAFSYLEGFTNFERRNTRLREYRLDRMKKLLSAFGNVLVPEMNNGQLITILRSTFLLPAVSLPKISGKPFKVREVTEGIRSALEI